MIIEAPGNQTKSTAMEIENSTGDAASPAPTNSSSAASAAAAGSGAAYYELTSSGPQFSHRDYIFARSLNSIDSISDFWSFIEQFYFAQPNSQSVEFIQTIEKQKNEIIQSAADSTEVDAADEEIISDSSQIDFADEKSLIKLLNIERKILFNSCSRILKSFDISLSSSNFNDNFSRSISRSALRFPILDLESAVRRERRFSLTGLTESEIKLIHELAEFTRIQPIPHPTMASDSASSRTGAGKIGRLINNMDKESSEIEIREFENSVEIACSVCGSEETDPSNEILFCDAPQCNVAAHQKCAGISELPQHSWFCEPCSCWLDRAMKRGESLKKAGKQQPKCLLCGHSGGALMRKVRIRKLMEALRRNKKRSEIIKYLESFINLSSSDFEYFSSECLFVHSSCVGFVPELRLDEPLFSLVNIDVNRLRLRCSLCQEKYCGSIQCAEGKCLTAFHPYCALRSQLDLNVVADHSKPGGLHFYIYCSRHDSRDEINEKRFCESEPAEVESAESLKIKFVEFQRENKKRKLIEGITQSDDENDEENGEIGLIENPASLSCELCRFGSIPTDSPLSFLCSRCGVQSRFHSSCYERLFHRPIQFSHSAPAFDSLAWEFNCNSCQNADRKFCCLCCSLVDKNSTREFLIGCSEAAASGFVAHLKCAMLIPEIYFAPDSIRFQFSGLDRALIARRALKCSLCSAIGGAPLVCEIPDCGVQFHVNCGKKLNWEINKDGRTAKCGKHSKPVEAIESLNPQPIESADDCGICCVERNDIQDSTTVTCSICDSRVHAECFFSHSNPSSIKNFICDSCSVHNFSPHCSICLSRGGALALTTENSLVHVQCALFVPELFFQTMLDRSQKSVSVIAGVSAALKSRRPLICCVCFKPDGAPVQCSRGNCMVAFHVSCAREAGFRMEDNKNAGKQKSNRLVIYCEQHSEASGDESAAAIPIDIETTKQLSPPSKCQICCPFDSNPADASLLACSNCGIVVHTECYLGPHSSLPSGIQWNCDACVLKSADFTRWRQLSVWSDAIDSPRCAVCQATGGSFCLTKCKRQIHWSCLPFLNEFDLNESNQISSSLLPFLLKSFRSTCSLCPSKGGLLLPCCSNGCPKFFHYQCAISAGYSINPASEQTNDGKLAFKCKRHVTAKRAHASEPAASVDGAKRVKRQYTFKNKSQSATITELLAPIRFRVRVSRSVSGAMLANIVERQQNAIQSAPAASAAASSSSVAVESAGPVSLYCICRRPYVEGEFMIACDGTDCVGQWFHGSCVNIEESDALAIENYYCDDCKQKKVKYRFRQKKLIEFK